MMVGHVTYDFQTVDRDRHPETKLLLSDSEKGYIAIKKKEKPINNEYIRAAEASPTS